MKHACSPSSINSCRRACACTARTHEHLRDSIRAFPYVAYIHDEADLASVGCAAREEVRTLAE